MKTHSRPTEWLSFSPSAGQETHIFLRVAAGKSQINSLNASWHHVLNGKNKTAKSN